MVPPKARCTDSYAVRSLTITRRVTDVKGEVSGQATERAAVVADIRDGGPQVDGGAGGGAVELGVGPVEVADDPLGVGQRGVADDGRRPDEVVAVGVVAVVVVTRRGHRRSFLQRFMPGWEPGRRRS